MDKESFRDMFNGLIKSYQPKVKFEFEDYFDQVKYIPENRVNDLRKKIVENCDYFPKPAELKKIASEFKTPYKKPEHPEINYDNCFCGKPVWNATKDPYRCKDCYEAYQSNREEEHQRYIEMGYPVDQKKEDQSLINLINDIRSRI